MTTATRQPMSTWAMIETAKRLLSTDVVKLVADNVMISRSMFGGDGEPESFRAYQYSPTSGGSIGRWIPEVEWDLFEDVRECDPGKFIAD
jgi:hypothetical protein